MSVNPERYAETLARLDRFSSITDSRFTIPYTRIRFGLDPLIGLIPGVGDAFGLILSLYVLVEAVRVGAPKRLLGRMLANILVEFVGGIVPIIGDAFDVYWKANTRNTALLRGHIQQQLTPPQPKRVGWKIALLVVVTILFAVLTLWWLVKII